MKKHNIFKLDIISTTESDALSSLIAIANSSRRDNRIIVTPNVDHIVKLYRADELLKTYSSADFIFPDGMPLILGSQLLGKSLKNRITGADLFENMCSEAAKSDLLVYVVGGNPSEVNENKKKMKAKFPGLLIEIDSPAYGFEPNGNEAIKIVSRINRINPDIVFVCLGFPKQELFSFHHKNAMKVKLIFNVGASMDFAIGKIRRAPLWIQQIGMEWFWRMSSDPKRLVKRYLIEDIVFIKIFFNEWLKVKDSKK